MGTLSALLYGFNIVLWLWSFRNFGRFLLFFTSCLVFLESKDYELLRRSFYVIGHICFLLCLYQFFVLKLRGDYIGGVFGTNHGVANTWINVFIIVLFTFSITDWFSSGKGGLKFLIVVLESAVIAVVGELKFLFLEIIIIILLCFILFIKTYKRFYKSLFVSFLGIIVLCITIPVLYKMFPMFRNFFTFDTLVKTATESYTGNGDLGRLTAIHDISENIFDRDLFKILFGIGLGNGEYSGQQTFLQSEFYIKYQYTNYNWFTDAIIMVQNGLLGVFLYLFGLLYLLSIQIRYLNNSKNIDNSVYSSFILIVLCFFLFFYNLSLNCEIAYLMYAFVSFGISQCVLKRKFDTDKGVLTE